MDKIKRIILGNPYKYSNYMEHNTALIPEKLIQRNLVDPTPIFDDDDGDEELYQGLAAKLGGKKKLMYKQYLVYKELNNPGLKQQKEKMKMP